MRHILAIRDVSTTKLHLPTPSYRTTLYLERTVDYPIRSKNDQRTVPVVHLPLRAGHAVSLFIETVVKSHDERSVRAPPLSNDQRRFARKRKEKIFSLFHPLTDEKATYLWRPVNGHYDWLWIIGYQLRFSPRHLDFARLLLLFCFKVISMQRTFPFIGEMDRWSM